MLCPRAQIGEAGKAFLAAMSREEIASNLKSLALDNDPTTEPIALPDSSPLLEYEDTAEIVALEKELAFLDARKPIIEQLLAKKSTANRQVGSEAASTDA